MLNRLRLSLIILTILLILPACTTKATIEAPPEVEAPTAAPGEESETPEDPPSPAQPAGETAVLISEVLTGIEGNNNVEFIELVNTGTEIPFDLKGWSLWYKLAEGQDEILVIRWTDHALVPPQGHYVLGRLGYDIGITPDMPFETPMVHPKGGLQLRMTDGTIVDSLAWGAGPTEFAEGSIAPAMGNGTSLERAPGGDDGNFLDTDDNGTDFIINQFPDPQNSGSPLTPDPVAQLQVVVSAPETAEPGDAFEYTLSVTNDTGGDVSGLTVQLPIPLDLAVPNPPTGVTISEQATHWGMPQIDIYHQVALWSINKLADGETSITRIPVETPWSVMIVTAANYSAQAEDWPAPAFGAPVHTSIEGGVVPIGNLFDLVSAELTVEGTATMQTGGLYAGGGNVKFYMEDETGGVQVWVPEGEGEVSVSIGQLVRAHGKLELYRGALELITNTPFDIEILAGPNENPAWPPTEVSIPEAINNTELQGRLITVEGLVTRNEEFSYSFEIDLMDENGEILPLYVDKQTMINVETIEAGDLYRITGILEMYDPDHQLYPRVQSDFERIYPPELMIELEAPISVVTGDNFEVTLTASNHTLEPLSDVTIVGIMPLRGATFDSASEGGEVNGSQIIWTIPELAGEGESVSVNYVLKATASDGYMTIQDYSATAVEWPEPVSGDPHYVFLGDTVPIWAIQGPGFRSPYVMQPVTTQGIVTGLFPELGGFWIQEIETDKDPLTSSGLFINAGLAQPDVIVGDDVQVSGLVRETSQQTQIFVAEPKESIDLISEGNPLPKSVELGPPPDQLESDRYYETIEGMLVQVSGRAQAVGPTSKYGEYVMVLPSHGFERLWQGDEAINGIAIMVDDGSAAVHEDSTTLDYVVDVGNQVSGVIGPLAYTFSRYKIEPVTIPEITSQDDESLPNLSPADSSEFSIMTWNVENLFDTRPPHPSDPPMLKPSEYRLRIEKIANTIEAAGAPLIVGLQELENIAVLEDIAASEILADYGYEALLIEGFDSRGIDNGYLIRGDRATFISVEQFIAPEGLTSRPPLLVQVEVATDNGPATLFVINNHFTSMSAGVEATEPRRNAQAAWNVEVMEGILAEHPEAYVAVIGDLNSFYDSRPIDTLREAGMKHVFETIPEDERYSYIFQGFSQTLDHILVTPSLFETLTRTEVLHVNADFGPPEPGDPSPIRTSDHDPVVAVFEMR
ncbi:endonuclease/exonuclease/phosphatase family protein [Chloroflexota bacterium]